MNISESQTRFLRGLSAFLTFLPPLRGKVFYSYVKNGADVLEADYKKFTDDFLNKSEGAWCGVAIKLADNVSASCLFYPNENTIQVGIRANNNNRNSHNLKAVLEGFEDKRYKVYGSDGWWYSIWTAPLAEQTPDVVGVLMSDYGYYVVSNTKF